jgi:hypothetical protein
MRISGIIVSPIFSSSLCLQLFGFVKLAFVVVSFEIGAALSIVIAFVEVVGFVLFSY